MSHIENKIGEFATTFNKLVDAHNDREDDIGWIKSKLVDLEACSRRNNVKIHSISESVQNQKLKAYFTKTMMAALSDSPIEELVSNHIYRLPKLKHIPEHQLGTQ